MKPVKIGRVRSIPPVYNNSEEKSNLPKNNVMKEEIKTESFEKNQMDCKIISYYADFTPTPYYEKFAKELERKCVLFGVDHDICKLESRGSYGANCLMKPEFILDKIIEHKRPVMWMDCDTDFRNPFSNFNGIKQDLGMASHNGEISWITASPIYFNYTLGSFRVLREWVIHCRAAYEMGFPELDHDALKHYVLRVLKKEHTSYILSENYSDFVKGKYIFNGNSRIEGKTDIHNKMSTIKDSERDMYTAGVSCFRLYFSEETPDVIQKAYNFLEKFSNHKRLQIVLNPKLSELLGDSHPLMIESGGKVIFEEINFDEIKIPSKEILLSVKGVNDIEKDWDLKIFKLSSANKNPLNDLIFQDDGLGEIKIKTHDKLWN